MIGRPPPPAAPKSGPPCDRLCHSKVAGQDTACRVVERAPPTLRRPETQDKCQSFRNRGSLDPELHQILREISVAADRAVHLSSDLVSFSSRARTKPEAIDLNALIDGIRHLLTVSMSGSAKVLFEPWPTALPGVLADRGQLEQVLFNLAVNARDAMPEGGTLTIRTRIADLSQEHAPSHPAIRRGRYVELAVSDTGIGMNADVRPRIFERFFTTKPPARAQGSGCRPSTASSPTSAAPSKSTPGKATALPSASTSRRHRTRSANSNRPYA
jgi:signal transduction histidine kinase